MRCGNSTSYSTYSMLYDAVQKRKLCQNWTTTAWIFVIIHAGHYFYITKSRMGTVPHLLHIQMLLHSPQPIPPASPLLTNLYN